MARRLSKIEIRNENDEMLPEFIQKLKPAKIDKDKHKSQSSRYKLVIKQSDNPINKNINAPLPIRVFLYLKLEKIINLPSVYNRMKIKLQHSSFVIHKLADQHNLSSTIDISSFDSYKPTFSVSIEQDSVEYLNRISDSPLCIMLYEERINNSEENGIRSDSPSAEVEAKLVALGIIDLLQFFGSKRAGSEMQIYIYPLSNKSTDYTLPTIRSIWQVYTLLPLLKNISFCNLTYISFESIYNANSELMEECDNLTVLISFQSKILNDKKEYDKITICSFSHFTKCIISEQDTKLKWEAIKTTVPEGVQSLAIYTDCYINTYVLFKKLLGTEGVNFHFDDIDISKDFALTCNSVHRYILTKELVRILEDTVAFNEQELLVEVYKAGATDKILLKGVIDLSIFLYPMVNAIRFAVELRPIEMNPTSNATSATTKGSEPNSKRGTAKMKRNTEGGNRNGTTRKSNIKIKPTFAIISICLISPITAAIEKMSLKNEIPIQRQTLKKCSQIASQSVVKLKPEKQEDNYRQFDQLITMLINYIVQHGIKSTMEAKNFFCCHMENLVNKVTKLISCDFNRRFPTKTNAEFANLMTTVYKELVQRIYDIVQNCDIDNVSSFLTPSSQIQRTIISLMNAIKYVYEVGNNNMGDFLLEKLKLKNSNNTSLNFYLYLYDVEKRNFEAAKSYQSRPINEQEVSGDYFTQIIRIYIDYLEDLSTDDNSLNALENVLESLRYLTLLYPLEADGFVLLHCLYKNSGYLPGVSFMRWKYENLEERRLQLQPIPISLWEMFNNYELTFKTEKGLQFYNSVKLFLHLGLYKFADIVYQEIAIENTEVERYFMVSTLKILQNDVDKKYVIRNYPSEKLIDGQAIKAFNAQINGNLDYFLGNTDKAMKSYESVLKTQTVTNFENYQLSLLRYGYKMMEMHEYNQAIQAFDKCCIGGKNGLVPNFEVGKAFYRLNRLSDAEKYFAKATDYAMHIPDMWGYLALVNLKMGQNFKALECWKYAKLDPDNVIADEILEELGKIKHEDISLYVDVPK